jgi:hemolysin III
LPDSGARGQPTALGRWDSALPIASLILAAAGFSYLLVSLPWNDGLRPVASALIYGITLVASFLSSSLYHWSSHPRARRVFQAMDHGAIYLLIAGTVTPFALMPLWDHLGYVLLFIVWLVAFAGIAVRLFMVRRLNWLGTAGYLALGWAGIAWIYPLAANLGNAALGLLIGGGIAYTSGLVFFHWTSFRFGNAVWHAFVLAGAAAHFASVALQLQPAV